MTKPLLDPNSVCQVALVVADVQRAAENYAKVFGVPVPAIRETGPAEQTQIRYRGQTTSARAKLAFFQLGPLSLELIEPISGPSTWRDVLAKNGPGLHHIAFKVPGTKATATALEEIGGVTVQTGDFGSGNYSYVDASEPLGVLLELLEIYPPKA